MLVKKLLELWMSFARFVGRVNTIILLTVVYLLVITPVGIGMRLMGRNCLRTPVHGSLWTGHSESEDLERQF
jgi:hypothetical protein